MTVYPTDIDQSGIIKQFTSSYQIAFVKAGVTLVSENDAVFASLDSSGYSDQVINYGTLVGGTTTVFFGFGSSNDTLDNFGVISGGPSGYAAVGLVGDSGSGIMNSGTIYSAVAGVYMSGTSDFLTNAASISAPIGVEMIGNTELFTNTGTVTGPKNGVFVSGTGDSITNRGMIEGSVDASAGSTTTLRNSGTIDGNVALGSGINTYDGRGGTVDGTISGGSGVDKILAGSDGATMNGGGGHDRLFGGAGADTFAFNSFAAADQDRIFMFDVSRDVVQLDQSKFTKLVADQTPTFSVGTAATSPTDYLFYNASTGVLAYDPDGNGSHYAGYTIATLDKGLALTANNFTVV